MAASERFPVVKGLASFLPVAGDYLLVLKIKCCGDIKMSREP